VTFIHEDNEFNDLIQIVAGQTGISRALVEKDYWVVHALWALHQGPFDIWFKGGTSLSKGFALIQRFSEDLDLRVVPQESAAGPTVNWTAKKPSPAQLVQRKDWFRWLAEQIRVPACAVLINEDHWRQDLHARGADIHVRYPGQHLDSLAQHNLPYVKLEIGDARVTPFVVRPVSSFVHDHLQGIGMLGNYEANRPEQVRHVHPWVTLVEKLSIIAKKYGDGRFRAEGFVRHYGDAAQIAIATLEPPDGYTLTALVAEMVSGGTVGDLPSAASAALCLSDEARRTELESAHADLAGMYWGPRQSLADACAVLRAWVAQAELPGPANRGVR
jgi:hypothetical protein